MKKIIFLVIIAIVLLSFYPDVLADVPGGKFIVGILNTVHSFFSNLHDAYISMTHRLTDAVSSLMDIFKTQKANY